MARIANYLFPENRIRPEWRYLWKEKERRAFRTNAYYFFSFFAVAYVAHFFLIDRPLHKEPIELWAKYRFGLAMMSLVGLFITRFAFLKLKHFKVPLVVAGWTFGFMQAQSMTWRAEVPYSYSIILPCIAAIALRASVPTSLGFLLLCFTSELPAWMSRTEELSYDLSAAIVGAILVSLIRSRVTSDVDAFIAQQERLEAQEQKAAAELESASQISSLSAQIAHDIRSPLALLKTAVRDSSITDEARQLLSAASDRIRGIADALLDTNRKATLSPEPKRTCNLRDLLSVIETEKATLAGAAEISFDFGKEKEKESFDSRIQAGEFLRVVSNLIDNAVEAVGGAGSVRVVLVRTSDGLITLSIKDNGRGIPENVIPQLFQRGVSFGKAKGNGLGLFHAKTVVESWGGMIRISSTVGKGTEVEILLPYSSD